MTISNRTGVKAELEFLKNWGLTFSQAFTDNPTRTYLKRHEETCIDAFQMLTGKKPNFGVDVASGLVRVKQYIALLDNDKAFPAHIAQQHFANLASIEKLLFEPKQLSLL